LRPEINIPVVMEWNEKQLQILNVAEDLFASKGYEGTSVRDIAQKAEVNVAMISYYFGSKEKLLESLILSRAKRTNMVLAGLSHNRELDPWEKMDRIVDYYVDTRLDNRNFHTIMSRQMSMDQDPAITEMLIGVKKKNTAMIADIIREGQQKKIFRQVNTALTICSIVGTISQASMSRPFYGSLMKLDPHDDESYFKKIRSKLKAHLKSLLRAHLSITGEQ
jgi:AcrR family transcriptional regulator